VNNYGMKLVKRGEVDRLPSHRADA
jgi:hypothetical protein